METNEELLKEKIIRIPGIEYLAKTDIEDIIKELEKNIQNKKIDTNIIK